MSLPFVSIVIPARNEEDIIDKCLKAINNQNYPHFEIIVVDNGSSDQTAHRASLSGAKVIHENIPGRGRARNKGYMSSNAEWIAFVDADCVVERDWLLNLIQCGMLSSSSVLQGPIIPQAENNSSLLAFRKFRLQQKTKGMMSFLPLITKTSPLLNGAAFLIKRKCLECVGGFDENLPRHQDIDLGRRVMAMGYDFQFVPEAKAEVYFKSFWFSYLKRSYEVGKYRRRLSLKWNLTGPSPTSIAQSFKNALKAKGKLSLYYHIDEIIIFLGEYLSAESYPDKFVPTPAFGFILTHDDVKVFNPTDEKWRELDFESGNILRMMLGRMTRDELCRLINVSDTDLLNIEEELRNVIPGLQK